jgi:hypothetical protein
VTVAQVLAFADSPGGKVYARVCERWGRAPGDALDDDYLAFQLEAALALALSEGAPPTDPFEQTRQAGTEARRQMGMD